MRFPDKETVIVRTVYENTYETLLDYVMHTSNLKNLGKVHTIWAKGTDPYKKTND